MNIYLALIFAEGYHEGLDGTVYHDDPLFVSFTFFSSSAVRSRSRPAANAASPATTTALLRELHASQPALLQRATRSIPDMLPKAYRWIGEMEEISEFVGEPLQDVHKGMSNVYRRVRDSVDGDGDDQRVLEKFVKDAIEILEKEKESI